MEDNQVYVQGDFSFIKNDDLRTLFEKSYENDNETISKDPQKYFWARGKIDEITDDCWRSFVDTFDENKVLEEYKYNYNKMKNNMNNEPVTITNDFKNKINVPIVPFSQSAGKRKIRKTQKSRKPRRKTRKNKKTKKTKKTKKSKK
jgi:hypothetical protein